MIHYHLFNAYKVLCPLYIISRSQNYLYSVLLSLYRCMSISNLFWIVLQPYMFPYLQIKFLRNMLDVGPLSMNKIWFIYIIYKCKYMLLHWTGTHSQSWIPLCLNSSSSFCSKTELVPLRPFTTSQAHTKYSWTRSVVQPEKKKIPISVNCCDIRHNTSKALDWRLLQRLGRFWIWC